MRYRLERWLKRRPRLGSVRPAPSYMGHTYVQVGVPHGYRTQFDRELMAYRLVPRKASA